MRRKSSARARAMSFVHKDTHISVSGFAGTRHKTWVGEGRVLVVLHRGDMEFNFLLTTSDAAILEEKISKERALAQETKDCTDPTCYDCRRGGAAMK